MTARILVVDDIEANLKFLEARLLADYFDVVCTDNGRDALSICAGGQIDVILLDVMMPEMDGFEVCERLKADPMTAHIPVVMVTALDQPADRVRGLKAGADDFLTKPVNDLQLISRVKSLARLKTMSDELRDRLKTAGSIDIQESIGADGHIEKPGRILLIDGRASSQERIVKALKPIAEISAWSDPSSAIFEATENLYDLVIINSNFDDFDPLRLCSQLRSLDRTRFLPLLIVTEQNDDAMVVRALDLGVNDYIIRPIDPNELVARTLSQIKRKRFNERLREDLAQTMELAVIDGLTGLNNRRYLDLHLKTLFNRAALRGRDLSVCMTDIDCFKQVNDLYGHEAGDEVLKEFASRLRSTVRGADLACRYGGEEFVVVMPDTSLETATAVAERLRSIIENRLFVLRSGQHLQITASLGIASNLAGVDSPEQLMRQADKALYEAKRSGRNRVVAAAA